MLLNKIHITNRPRKLFCWSLWSVNPLTAELLQHGVPRPGAAKHIIFNSFVFF